MTYKRVVCHSPSVQQQLPPAGRSMWSSTSPVRSNVSSSGNRSCAPSGLAGRR